MTKAKFQSIRRKILVAALSGFSLSMVLTVLCFLLFYQRDSMSTFERSLESAQAICTKVLNLQTDRQKVVLHSIQHSPRFQSAIAVGIDDLPTLIDLAKTEHHLSGADFFFLASPEGRALVAIQGTGGTTSDLLTLSSEEMIQATGSAFVQAHLQEAVRKNCGANIDSHGIVSDLFIFRQGLLKVVSVPVYDPQDNLLGILALGQSVDGKLIQELASISSVDISFQSTDTVFASSLPPIKSTALLKTLSPHVDWVVDWHHYLAIRDLLYMADNQNFISLVVLKDLSSYREKMFWAVLLSLAFFVVVLGVSFVKNRNMAMRIVGPLQELTQAVSKVSQGNLDIKVELLTSDEVEILADNFNHMVLGLRERATMSRFLTGMELAEVRDVVHQEKSLQQTGQKREITVLFSDIRSFTTICENHDPALVIDSLNYYFNALIPILEKYKGSLDKLIGDCIMAVFESDSRANSAENALMCAIAMLRKMREIRPLMKAAGLLEFDAGFGINSGIAVVGNVGASDQLSRTVLGDVVNLAARVEGYSKEGKSTCILYTEQTRSILSSPFRDEFLMEVTVKGKTQPVRIYELSANEVQSGEI